jgi:acetylornithine deacetylase
VVAAGQELGRPTRPTGFHSWYDGATFTKLGSTPSIGFGPGSLNVAHTIDEYVPIRDLVDCAKGIALTAMRFCGGVSA